MTQNEKNRIHKKHILWFSLFLINLFGFSLDANAQRTCNTVELHEKKMNNPKYRTRFLAKQAAMLKVGQSEKVLCSNPVILPMAVHYSGLGELSTAEKECLIALAEDQIQILNDDYQGTNSDIDLWSDSGGASERFPDVNNGETCIQFCLAKFNHPNDYELNNGDVAVTFNQVTGDNSPAWAGYINIFVKNISALGYSPLGGDGDGDGVAIDLAAFGSGSGCPSANVVPGAPYNLGRTLTHELGHYLLLDHIWGSGCGGDDDIADTPNASDSNYGCPNNTQSSCSSLDLHMNYMDYTNDACMYMFSEGQSTVMENYTANNLTAVIEKGESVCGKTIGFVEATSSKVEGSRNCSGTASHMVTAELQITSAPVSPVTVNLSVAGASTATIGEDYQNFSTTVIFPAGSTANQTINITIFEDGYEENDEALIIDIVNVNNSDYSIISNNQFIHTINNDDVEPSLNKLVTVMEEDFNSGLGNWFTIDGGSSGNSWNTISSFEFNSLNGSSFVFVDSDAAGNGSTSYETLLSPVFDATGVVNLTLSFDHYFRVYSEAYLEQIDIEVFDGTSWQNVYNETGTVNIGSWNSPAKESIDIDTYANSAMQIRFIYDGEWDYYWAIDNIKIEGRTADNIQTSSNTGAGFAEHDLGPNQTVYFYDQSTGNIMATIENLSNHDYGCTKIEIDNSGTTSYAANDSSIGDLTAKNFKIKPQFNNATGAYNIKLYYTAAEIDGWVANNSAGEPASALKMIKGEGSVRDATNLQSASVTVDAFGGNWTYMANFNTGFSGFALGNQAANDVLPIDWKSIRAVPINNSIQVEWTTSQEVDNQGFAVQRKTDAGFETIARVDPNDQGQYVFVDKNVRSGITYYYQIVQSDFAGKTTNSTIVSAMVKTDNPVSIQPNPFKDELFIFGNHQLGLLQIDIFNVVGKQVFQGEVGVGDQLNLSHLECGIYIVNLTDTNGVTSTHKMIKQ